MKMHSILAQEYSEQDNKTYLYDITVDEDHSFIVEGLVSHNCGPGCNCTFSWENKELDDLADAFGHIQIGIEGNEPTGQPEFTLYPDEKSLLS